MNCKEAKEYLEFKRANKILIETNDHLNNHLRDCPDCKNYAMEIDQYFNTVSRLKRLAPAPVDKDKFTKDVLQQIKNHDQTKYANGFSLSFTRLPFFRIAGIVVILLSVISFLVQNYETNKAIVQLESRYKQKKNYKTKYNSYQDCVAYSRSMIATIIKDDNEMINMLFKNPGSIHKNDIVQFASLVCKQSVKIESLSPDEQKALLLNFFREQNL